MKTYTWISALALTLALLMPMSGALAAQGGAGGGAGSGSGGAGSAGSGSSVNAGTGVGSGTQDQDRIQQQDQIRDPSTHTGDEPDQTRDQTRDQDQLRINTTTPAGGGSQTQTQGRTQGQAPATQTATQNQYQQLGTTTPPRNGDELRQMIQERQQLLDQQASTTPLGDQNMVRRQNQLQLAVEAVGAAQPMLGSVGPQMLSLAQQVQASASTTAGAEAKIQTRGFWTNFFFGGDSQSAGLIAQEVAQNQTRIEQMTQLLNQSGVPADVQATLQEQIQALEQEQTRLQALAQQEQNRWGLFSWRF